MIPTIVPSVGVSSRLNGNDASFPRHQKTSSPTPAPTASSATIGCPLSCKSASRVWTIRNFRPLRGSFFTVESTVPMTRAICILSFAFEIRYRRTYSLGIRCFRQQLEILLKLGDSFRVLLFLGVDLTEIKMGECHLLTA